MPRRIKGEEPGEGAKRSLVEGPYLAVCLCIGLVLVLLFLFHDPRLVARNAVTRSAGLAPKTDVTTTTTDPPPPTTTAPLATTTTTGLASTPRTVVAPTQTPTTTPAPVPTTAPPASTTTAPTYVPPHIATQTIPGAFGSEAGVVSGSWPITTAGGVVSATGTWSGGNALSLSVTCASGGSSSQQGTTGLTVSATCNQGSATVSFGEIAPDQTNVSYNLDISYPSN